MDEVTDRSWGRWVLAALAAVATIGVLVFLIGSIIPTVTTGPKIGGVGMEELRTACKLVGREDRDLCQRVFRVDAAIDEGRCQAAEVQARPVLALPEGTSPLRDRLRTYTEARLAPCRATDAAQAVEAP